MKATSIAAVEVTVDGAVVPAELAARVVSVRVASRLGLPTQCELAYATVRGSAAELDTFPLGASVSLRVAGDTTELFDGEITAVTLAHAPDGATVNRIRCYDRLHRLRKRQELRVFTDVNAAELAERLAGDAASGVEADDPGPTIGRIVQYGQTDFSLLCEVAARAGLYPVLDGETLRLVTLQGSGDEVDLELGGSLLEATVQANLDRAADGLTALGWDRRTARPFREEASSPRVGRSIGVEPQLGDLHLDGELTLVDQPGATPAEVAAYAQAELDRRTATAATLRGVAAGDAALRAGVTVNVGGMAPAFAGRYVLTEAVHTVDATGYLTTLSTEPPERPPAERSTSITLGTVTDVDDPDQLGRVQVSLPSYGEADVGWLGVLCPGAGAKRGIVALPDVGDTVLVALSHGPVGGIVLGSMYGAVNPPDDAGVQGGRVKRWSLHTADGQRVVVDDAKHSITLTNRGGSRLRLAPGKVTLHAAADLDITAPGKTITVKANAVEFVRAEEAE